MSGENMAECLGIEPRSAGLEAAVLPLDEQTMNLF